MLATVLGASHARFLAEHWGRRPLHVGGDVRRFDPFFRPASLDAVLERAIRAGDACPPGFAVRSLAKGTGTVTIPAAEARARLAGGATLDVVHVEHLDPGVRELVAALKGELSYAGDVSSHCWASTRKTGVGKHFDATGVLVLQLEGRKRWRLSPEIVLASPLATGLYAEDGTVTYRDDGHEDWEYEARVVPDDAFVDVVLVPGDVLYVPAGTVHTTAEVDDERAMALHVFFDPVDVFGMVMASIRPPNVDARWRELPPSAADLKDGALPSDVAAAFRGVLADLRARLDALEAAGPTLACAWHRAIAHSPPPPPPPPPREELAVALARHEVLRVARHAPFRHAHVLDPDPALVLFHGAQEIRLDGADLVELGQRLVLHRGGFVAETTTEWTHDGTRHEWSNRQELLEQLLTAGILERVA